MQMGSAMKVAVYSNGTRKVWVDPVESVNPMPLSIVVDNETYAFDKQYMCGTESQIQKLKDHFEQLNISYHSQ